MRNNSGAYKDATGRLVRYGLDNTSATRNKNIKSSDLIGFTVVEVTPEMVGQKLAVFTAVEVKDPNWRYSSKDQRAVAQNNFLNWIASFGGIAFFANSLETFHENLKRYLVR
jgi:hypothetical protein